MSFIREYTLSIIAIVLFSVLLEIMMPSSNFKKYIKLVAGLLVMFVVIRPIVKLPALEETLTAFHISDASYGAQSMAVRDRVAAAQSAQVKETFSAQLQQSIQSAIAAAFGQSSTVSVIFDGERVTAVSITVSDHAEEIRQFVAANYGLDAAVTIGGDDHDREGCGKRNFEK